MNINLRPETLAVLAVVGVIGVVFVARRGVEAVGEVAQAVNPLNHDNVFATSVNAVGGALVTDPNGPGKNADGSWTLGGWAFDLLNPSTARAVANISKPLTY